jgi:folate-binding protein YgfZ
MSPFDSSPVHLAHRGVVMVTGEDSRAFLQGLITNDMALLTPDQPLYTCLLTSQGKFLFDAFIFAQSDYLLMDVYRDTIPALITHLSRYRLQSKVNFTDVSDKWHVYIGGAGTPDPRTPTMGSRFLSQDAPSTHDITPYHLHRIKCGVPEGHLDLIPEKDFPLLFRLDHFHAISFTKGCYIGQEVTARTHYRGVIRQRLVRVEAEAQLEAGADLFADNAKVGRITSAVGSQGLALIRQEAEQSLPTSACTESGVNINIIDNK